MQALWMQDKEGKEPRRQSFVEVPVSDLCLEKRIMKK